jgi:hypothetical protein
MSTKPGHRWEQAGNWVRSAVGRRDPNRTSGGSRLANRTRNIVAALLALVWVCSGLSVMASSPNVPAGRSVVAKAPVGTHECSRDQARGYATCVVPRRTDTLTRIHRPTKTTEVAAPSSNAVASRTTQRAGDKTVDQNSTPRNPQRLTISQRGSALGTIVATAATSGVARITCPPACEQDYPEGTSVTFRASDQPGVRLVGWNTAGCPGTGPCTVRMSRDLTVSPEFVKAPLSAGTLPGWFTGAPPGWLAGPPEHTRIH